VCLAALYAFKSTKGVAGTPLPPSRCHGMEAVQHGKMLTFWLAQRSIKDTQSRLNVELDAGRRSALTDLLRIKQRKLAELSSNSQ
jgi:hypothetical protein